MPHDAKSPQDLAARLEQAEQLKNEGKHEEAIGILEQILVEDPSNVTALEEIADNELSLDQFSRAEAAALRAISLDATSFTGYYILGFIRSHESRWQDAITHLQRANRLQANNPEILRCLGWALFNAGERSQGVVTLERSLNLESDSPLTLCDLGVVYLTMQHYAKAKALFLRVLDLEPNNARAKECIAMVERLEKEVKK